MKQRKQRIVFPALQRRMIALILTSAGTSVLIFTCAMAFLVARVARELPNDGNRLLEALPGLLTSGAGITLLLALPAFCLLGVSASFRVFGPLYRFTLFVDAVAKGEQTEPCQLREKDLFQDVCRSLNAATEERRRINGQRAAA